MGLSLRLNLFHEVSAEAVLRAVGAFYEGQGKRLVNHGDEFWALHLHEREGAWTTLWLDGGWEWNVRRQAQLDVSRRLGCAGFLIFVFDGDYWGYEFFSHGEVLDQFVQEDPEDGVGWFPGRLLVGDAGVLARRLGLRSDDVKSYLVRDPTMSHAAFGLDADDVTAHLDLQEQSSKLDVPARPGDEFTRFHECSVLDFLRLLGVDVELRDGRVRLLSPEHRRFWIEGQNTFESRSTGTRR